MGIVKSNNMQYQSAREQTFGVLPGSPSWLSLSPDSLGDFGAKISKVARNPIDKSRQRKKGTTVDVDSSVTIESDLIMEHLVEFGEAFFFSTYTNVGNTGLGTFVPTGVTATGYTVAALGALTNSMLVFARGFTNSANNGLKVLAGTSTATEIKTTGLVVEAAIPAAQNVSVEVAGFRGAAGDIQIDAAGDLTATVLNFTTLGLTVGQYIWIGGDAVGNQFANANNRGLARIVAISATKLTLDRTTNTFALDTGATKQIDIFFGAFLRNVAVDSGSYLARSYTIEAVYPNLQSPGPGDMYQYARGNYANELSITLPLTDKAGMSIGFIGKDTDNPTTVRATNASTARAAVQTVAFNTSADIARLIVAKVDETGISTYFKDMTISIKNNVSPEKVLGTLGAIDMNTGDFEVDIDSTLVLSNSEVISAIRSNLTVGMWFGLRNDDGGFVMDIPSMTLGAGDLAMPENESVTIKMSAMTHEDPVLRTSLSMSRFSYLPVA